MLYFKIQPGPVAKNAPLRPPAANRIRDSVNLVQCSAIWATKARGKSFVTSSAQDLQGRRLDSHYKIDSIAETNGLVSNRLVLKLRRS